MSTSPRSSRRRGFSLLEILIVFTLLAVLFVLALGGVSEGAQMVNEGLAADTMRREAIQALQKIANDLKATDRGAVSISSVDDEMTLVKGTGWTSAGGQTWDPIEHVYTLSNGKLILSYVGDPQLLANDVFDFQMVDDTGTALNQTPLLPATSNVTFVLTLRRQLGVNADGSPHILQVTQSRTVFVRSNL